MHCDCAVPEICGQMSNTRVREDSALGLGQKSILIGEFGRVKNEKRIRIIGFEFSLMSMIELKQFK